MTNCWRLAGGAALALAVATLFAAGCGGSSQALAPARAAQGPEVDMSFAAGQVALTDARDIDEDAPLASTPIGAPTTITEPGDYRLTADLAVAEGDAIVITASHVRLWLGEHRLRGPGNKTGRAVVIEGADDVTVRGGKVERFGLGAVLIDASHCRVRDLDIQGGDETADPPNGNPPQIGIMLVNSAQNEIVGTRMRDVNLGIFVRGGGSYANQIRGNDVKGGMNGLLAICYNPAPGGDPAGPMNDRVESNDLARFGTGISASAQSANNLFAKNAIRYFVAAYEDLNGTNEFVRNRTSQITP